MDPGPCFVYVPPAEHLHAAGSLVISEKATAYHPQKQK